MRFAWIIGGAAGVILIVTVGFLLIRALRPDASPSAPGPIGGDSAEVISAQRTTFPQGAKISLTVPSGSVTVNNPYARAVDLEEGIVILAEEENYVITFEPGPNLFRVTVRSGDFNEQRAAGESRLLDILGTSREEACRLEAKVRLDIPDREGREFDLGFCETGI